MIELLGPMPRTFALGGSNFEKFFRREGKDFVYARIGGLMHFPLEKLLTDKYQYKTQEAAGLADFLL
jgi:serine/threonine-protein kinase SRPK3